MALLVPSCAKTCAKMPGVQRNKYIAWRHLNCAQSLHRVFRGAKRFSPLREVFIHGKCAKCVDS